ncbi:hypothetical protein GQR58_019471 [Nymphon striatum]|nr:hypothetical protein GQR58_019471 [Nymphon striatum]
MSKLPLPKILSLHHPNLREEWRRFLSSFELYLTATEADDKPDRIKIAKLLTVGGEEIQELFHTMAFDDVDYLSVENESGPRQLKYVAVVNKLTEHCTPKSNETYERFIFRNRVLMEGESVEIFITDLRKLSKSCNFGDLTNSLIKDQLVYGINDSKIQQRLLETSNLDLNKALEIINAIKVSRMQSSSLPHFSGTGQTSINSIKSETKIKAVTPNDEKLRKNCRFCGMTHKVRQCPAYGKKCDKCQKINHFAKVCKSVNVIDKESDSDSENSSDAFSLIGEIIKKRNANDWHIKSIIRNKEINFKLDTGAQCNVLPLHLIKTMKGVKIRNRAPKLISYSGNTIKTIGKADLELEYKQKFYIISFIIVQSKFMPVLGLETCLEMNLIKRVNAINAESKYKCLFSGLGCLPGKYKISTDESVPPVVHPPRKFPHTLKHKIKEELDRLEQFGVIHKVTKPTKWVNSMVVIRKTNNKIRLCLDPRDLNKAIKREHFPMKTVEEVAANLKNAKVFTTLDATQGFYQIRLDEESTWLTTFNTPFGRDGKQWIPAKCIETEDNVGPRSYLLQCKGATFRRNRKDILQTKEHFNESDICDKPPNIETSFKEVSNFNNSEHHSNQEEMDNGDVSDHINIKDEGDIIVSKVSGRVIRKPQRYRDT